MKKFRWIAIVLILVLILGGCGAPKDEEIEANTNSIPNQNTAQNNGDNNQPDDNANSNADAVTPSDTTVPTDSTGGDTPVNKPTQQNTKPGTPASNPDAKPNSDSGKTDIGSGDTTPTRDLSVVDISTDVRYFGRVYEQNDTYFFNWTESGFVFKFNGTGAEATFESNAPGGKNTAFLRIVVDGKQKVVALNDSMQTVELAKGLKKGDHTVWVYKRTNARSSSAGLMDITLAKGGTILKPPAPETDRKIEFIGDSLTVGYGVLGDSNTTEWSTKTEDGSQTFAAIAAQNLKAQYNVTAISGRGLAHNTSGDTDKLLPAIYDKVDEYNYAGHDWDFSKFQPDVIVMNLGANDAGKSSQAEIKDATVAFLKNIRKKNPNAYILVVYELNSSSAKQPEVKAALQSAVSSCGVGKVSYFSLPMQTGAVIGHPDKASHKAAAAALQKEISRITGWK